MCISLIFVGFIEADTYIMIVHNLYSAYLITYKYSLIFAGFIEADTCIVIVHNFNSTYLIIISMYQFKVTYIVIVHNLYSTYLIRY